MQRGFTILELLLALALASLVLLTAGGVLTTTMSAAAELRAHRARLDGRMNAARWLHAAFRSAESGPERSTGFDGRRSAVRFTTRLETPDGWYEPRFVVLRLDRHRLTASLDSSETLILADSVAALSFDYLLETGLEARWAHEWVSAVTAPLAVRVRWTWMGAGGRTDTLLFIIGPRG